MKISDFMNENYCLITDQHTSDRLMNDFYATDLLSSAIQFMNKNDILVTIISHVNTIGVAMMLDLSAIIIACDRPISQKMIDQANEEKIAIISTKLKTHEVIKDLVKRGYL